MENGETVIWYSTMILVLEMVFEFNHMKSFSMDAKCLSGINDQGWIIVEYSLLSFAIFVILPTPAILYFIESLVWLFGIKVDI